MLIKFGLQMSPIFPPEFVFTNERPQLFTGIVFKFHMHVHNFSIKLICIQYYPRLLSEEISEVC